ncbi:MAG: autotransporter-associated beta strand repeat-containing protein [Verrucomicrobia bacterium]|nr:autotransporter-associated beta strand repeat-containing protein [Verrucomicrobiota bacterium]
MKYSSASLFLAVSTLLSPLAMAADGTWSATAGGNWSDPLNWSGNAIADGSGSTASFTSDISATAAVTLDSSRSIGNLIFSDNGAAGSAWTISTNTLTLASGSTPTVTTTTGATISSVLAGSQGLAKSGDGTLTLGGSNTYTGTTTINSGVTSVASLAANGSNSGIGAGTDVDLNGGTLRYTGGSNGSDGGAKFNRNISVGAGGGTIDVGGTGFLFYAGTLTGSGTLKIIDGSGDANNRQLLVTGNSPLFSGNIEIGNGSANSGYVQQRSSAASPFGTAGIKINTGGLLASDGGSTAPSTLSNAIELSGGTLATQGAAMTYTGNITSNGGTIQSFVGGQWALLTANGNLTVNAATTLNGTGGSILIGGNISGTGALSVDGTGGGDQWTRRVRLKGNSGSASGTINVINSGKLWSELTASNNPIGDSADVNLATTTAVFNLYGPAGRKETIGGLYGSGTVDFSDAGGGNALTLEVGGGDKGGNFSGVVKNSAGTLSLSKTGSGTQILSGANTYSGSTTVNGGVLQVNGSLGSGTVTVNNSGHLKGNGSLGGSLTVHSGGAIEAGTSIGGSLTVESGGSLAPGDSNTLATLDVTGAAELAGTAAFEIQKSGATLTCDVLNAGGKITYGGHLTVTATGDPLALNDSFQLFTSGVGFGGAFGTFSLPTLPNGLSWDTSTLGSDGRITVVNYVGTPSFNPPAGGYVGAQNVTITSDSGSTIHYTTDGSDPFTSNTAISGPSPLSGVVIPLNTSKTIRAYASKTGQASSSETTAAYTTADSATWNVDADGLWSDPANWLNGVIPNASGAPVHFEVLQQTGPSTVTLDSNRTVGSLTFGNTNNFPWSVASSDGRVLTLDGPTPTITVLDITSTISATLAGTQGLVKSGAGTLLLTSANTYSGGTTVDGGVLGTGSLTANGEPSGIGSGSALSLNGGTFRYTGGNNGSDAGTKFNRGITVGIAGGTIDIGGSGFLFYSGNLDGSGTLKVIDSSGDASNRQLLVTSDNPSFSGNLEIGNGTANSGWVQYRSAAAHPFGTGTITLLTGGILSSDTGSGTPAALSNNIILAGGTLGAQYPTNLTGSVTATTGTTSSFQNIAGANLVLGGILLGNGTIQKNGGTWSVELRGDNSGFSGTYDHTADGATIFYTADSASAAASWNIPSGSNTAARFMAAASNGTYKLGALAGTTGRIENLNAASGNSVFEIGALGTDTTFGGIIRNGGGGTVGIKKIGGGKLTLTGTNTYTGGTVVNGGTLELAAPGSLSFAPGANGIVNGISGSGTLTLDGTINLTLTGADTTDGNSWPIVDVTNLTESYGDNFAVVGFTEVTPGVWTKSDGLREWTFKESTGTLSLPAAAGYDSWIGTRFPGETNPAIIGATADPDNDGASNIIEFVLDGNPASGTVTNAPAVTASGGNLVFTYTRRDDAEYLNPAVGFDNDLQGSWTTAVDGANCTITVEENGAAPDTVTVTIPKGANSRLFARLNVMTP